MRRVLFDAKSRYTRVGLRGCSHAVCDGAARAAALVSVLSLKRAACLGCFRGLLQNCFQNVFSVAGWFLFLRPEFFFFSRDGLVFAACFCSSVAGDFIFLPLHVRQERTANDKHTTGTKTRMQQKLVKSINRYNRST